MFSRPPFFRHHRPLIAGVLGSLLAAFTPTVTQAVINVGLQPSDLYERHEAVLAGEILSVNRDAGTFTVRVTAVLKGDSPQVGDQIEITATDGMVGMLAPDAPVLSEITPGKSIAAFVGKRQRRRQNELLFYAGGFYLGIRESATAWQWTAGDSQLAGVDGELVPTMLGTWNGATDQFIHMLTDIAHDRAYFPRRGYAAFREDMLIDQLDGPVKGVALYDIDQNGMPDIYACSPAGDRVYLQMEPLVFVHATEWLDLQQASESCAFADFDLDGNPDLLVDGTLLQGFSSDDQRWFEPAAALPLSETEIQALKTSSFIEANGDGYPDILVSLEGLGLRLLLNPGAKGGPFTDATAVAGLDAATAGAHGTGLVTAGDWNGDGRTDLFYATGSGILLVQDAAGKFIAQSHAPELRFTSGPEETLGLTGAGAFTPIFGTATSDLIIPVDSGWHVIANRGGRPVDVTEHGNEISEGSFLHFATVAADFTLDGHVDFYTVSRARNGHNRFIVNRGYGSFMLGDVHRAYDTMFNGPAQELGGWGLAAGDADGDSQPDLLIGNELGHLVLIGNNTLAQRQPVEHPTAEIAAMLRAGVLVVTVEGPQGVIGATVTLESTSGHALDSRFIAGNNAGGSRSPDEAIFAIREPGDYRVRVRYADGAEHTWPVVVGPASSAIARLTAHR